MLRSNPLLVIIIIRDSMCLRDGLSLAPRWVCNALFGRHIDTRPLIVLRHPNPPPCAWETRFRWHNQTKLYVLQSSSSLIFPWTAVVQHFPLLFFPINIFVVCVWEVERSTCPWRSSWHFTERRAGHLVPVSWPLNSFLLKSPNIILASWCGCWLPVVLLF